DGLQLPRRTTPRPWVCGSIGLGESCRLREKKLFALAQVSRRLAGSEARPLSVKNVLKRSPARLLKGVSQSQHLGLSEGRPEHLQSHWQLAADPSARHADPRQPRQRPCNRIYISKIHLQGVVHTFPELERRHR